MFIGRKKEMEALLNAVLSSQREFIAMLGQRGVGKTSTINHFEESLKRFPDITTVKIIGTKGLSDIQQQEYFLECFRKALGLTPEVVFQPRLKRWFTVFDIIKTETEKHLLHKRKVVFLIDEFSWFQLKKSDFFGSFTRFYDNLGGDFPVSFVVTGSAIAWLTDNLIHNKGGLYHKITKIHLKPFDLFESADYLLCKNPQLSPHDIVQYAMYTGGLPRFLDKIDPFAHIETNVKRLFSSINAFNENELENIFNYMFSASSNLHYKAMALFQDRSILDANILEHTLDISATTAQKILKELLGAGLVSVFKTEEKRNSKIRKAEQYRIQNLFCYYGFKALHDNKIDFDAILNPVVNGFAFEIFCHNHIEQFSKLLHFPTGYKSYGWRNKQAQIDLLLDWKGQQFLALECKFYQSKFKVDIDYRQRLTVKEEAFLSHLPTKKQAKVKIETALISVNGVEFNQNARPLRQIVLSDEINKYMLLKT